ncbi:reductive dehalogenase [Candidatus Bathyarchaeota archaeon]|nr:reductive dehalogenase [Candidatus Bathyarchaeota archaeon]
MARRVRRGIKIKKVEKPPYTYDPEQLERYDQINLIFNRIGMDPNFIAYQRSEEKIGLQKIKESQPGYTRLDYALAEASWTVHDVWTDGFNWERLERPYGPSLMGTEWYREKYEIDDLGKITEKVKKAARFFGANLVGIAEINKNWIYANRRRDLEPLKLPEGVKYAIVMAVEMDPLAIGTSPEGPAAAATGLGYSKMAFTASCIAEFIRNLGYTAVPAGNDTGLSVPLAIDAGLGQLGRNGLLITPEYGPRVRLFKVFTDLPVTPDKPIDFGVTEFCKGCRLCAEACEVDAISMDREPSWEPKCKSNNPGSLKWYVDAEKCYEYWCDNGTDCSTCISVCPYNNGPDEVKSKEFWKS